MKIYHSKEEMASLLKENVLQVKFTKADGTERVMECTLIPEMLPLVFEEQDEEQMKKKPRKQNDNVVSVFDLDAKEWRSFRLESIIDFRCIGQRTL